MARTGREWSGSHHFDPPSKKLNEEEEEEEKPHLTQLWFDIRRAKNYFTLDWAHEAHIQTKTKSIPWRLWVVAYGENYILFFFY